MDDDINRRLPFGLDKDKLAPPTSKTTDINEVKKNVSKVIKSPFQKQKEEAEKKKKREQEEADAVYREFVQSFSASDSKGKMFVRGETIMQTEKGLSVQHAVDNREYKLDAEIAKREVPKTTTDTAAPITGKKRTIDAFMEELKKQEEEKERRKFSKGPTGNRIEHSTEDELPDATSTNIFLGSLSLQVTEEILRREFSPYGTVVSVKVLWPKTEEEKKKARNSGFVQFATRSEAERAMEAMRDKEIMGCVPRLGWGRAPKHQAAQSLSHNFAPPPSISAAPPPWSQGTASAVQAPPQQLIVVPPSDKAKRETADRLAQLVVTHGQQFEQQLVERHSQHPKLSYLFQNGTNDNLYYRWRVYSLLQGDTLESWRTTPFVMFVGGPLWVPPPVPEPFQFDWSAFMKKFRTKPLLPRDLSEWKSLLEHLNLSRVSIRDAMIFAVERADSAAELVRVLSESMLVQTSELSPVLAIARLWLMSDILHNSNAGIQHGSQFRAGFQETLPVIFEALHAKYKTFTSRIMAQNFKDPIMRVLKIWLDWSLYPPDLLDQLRGVFVGETSHATPSLTSSAERKTAVPAEDDDDVDGVPL